MAGRAITRLRVLERLQPPSVSHPETKAAFKMVTDAIYALQDKQLPHFMTTMSLAIGDNRIAHGLGRTPTHAHVTPSVADVTFAWAMTSADDKHVVITTVGIAQPNAGVEIW